MATSKRKSSTVWFESLPVFSTGIVATSLSPAPSLEASRHLAESLIGGLPIRDASERVNRLTAHIDRLAALENLDDDDVKSTA